LNRACCPSAFNVGTREAGDAALPTYWDLGVEPAELAANSALDAVFAELGSDFSDAAFAELADAMPRPIGGLANMESEGARVPGIINGAPRVCATASQKQCGRQ